MLDRDEYHLNIDSESDTEANFTESILRPFLDADLLESIFNTNSKKYQEILTQLKNHVPYSNVFLNRVSKREVPNYYDIIHNPMDLGTMTKKIKKYSEPIEFKQDLDLIWANCKLFNGQSIFTDYAMKMKEKADSLYNKKFRSNLRINSALSTERESEKTDKSCPPDRNTSLSVCNSSSINASDYSIQQPRQPLNISNQSRSKDETDLSLQLTTSRSESDLNFLTGSLDAKSKLYGMPKHASSCLNFVDGRIKTCDSLPEDSIRFCSPLVKLSLPKQPSGPEQNLHAELDGSGIRNMSGESVTPEELLKEILHNGSNTAVIDENNTENSPESLDQENLNAHNENLPSLDLSIPTPLQKTVFNPLDANLCTDGNSPSSNIPGRTEKSVFLSDNQSFTEVNALHPELYPSRTSNLPIWQLTDRSNHNLNDNPVSPFGTKMNQTLIRSMINLQLLMKTPILHNDTPFSAFTTDDIPGMRLCICILKVLAGYHLGSQTDSPNFLAVDWDELSYYLGKILLNLAAVRNTVQDDFVCKYDTSFNSHHLSYTTDDFMLPLSTAKIENIIQNLKLSSLTSSPEYILLKHIIDSVKLFLSFQKEGEISQMVSDNKKPESIDLSKHSGQTHNSRSPRTKTGLLGEKGIVDMQELNMLENNLLLYHQFGQNFTQFIQVLQKGPFSSIPKVEKEGERLSISPIRQYSRYQVPTEYTDVFDPKIKIKKNYQPRSAIGMRKYAQSRENLPEIYHINNTFPHIEYPTHFYKYEMDEVKFDYHNVHITNQPIFMNLKRPKNLDFSTVDFTKKHSMAILQQIVAIVLAKVGYARVQKLPCYILTDVLQYFILKQLKECLNFRTQSNDHNNLSISLEDVCRVHNIPKIYDISFTEFKSHDLQTDDSVHQESASSDDTVSEDNTEPHDM